jgi:hypothetical protein
LGVAYPGLAALTLGFHIRPRWGHVAPVNDRLRQATDQPTIGLILCQTKDNVLAQYALSGIDKPIGVSSYELTRALPETLQSALPTVEQIEAELEKVPETKTPPVPSKPKPRRRKAKDR